MHACMHDRRARQGARQAFGLFLMNLASPCHPCSLQPAAGCGLNLWRPLRPVQRQPPARGRAGGGLRQQLWAGPSDLSLHRRGGGSAPEAVSARCCHLPSLPILHSQLPGSPACLLLTGTTDSTPTLLTPITPTHKPPFSLHPTTAMQGRQWRCRRRSPGGGAAARGCNARRAACAGQRAGRRQVRLPARPLQGWLYVRCWLCGQAQGRHLILTPALTPQLAALPPSPLPNSPLPQFFHSHGATAAPLLLPQVLPGAPSPAGQILGCRGGPAAAAAGAGGALHCPG